MEHGLLDSSSQCNTINGTSQQWYPMVKRKVVQPKPSYNSMGVQSGANLTGTTMSSQSHELETSSFADCNAMTTPPPMGGEAGAQESPSTSNIELEYDVVLPDKGKGKCKISHILLLVDIYAQRIYLCFI